MTKRDVRKVGIAIIQPFKSFFATQSAGGIVLMIVTVLALIAANSGFADTYHHLLDIEFGVHIGDFSMIKPLHFWVNDGLMAVFFFLVGLEIKREILVGELASFKKAALPIFAAIGGMAFPAILYAVKNAGTPGAEGWAIPTATDIAFALGILSLLGKRVPLALKVFLTALAIVDDLGAVLIIAIFYTDIIVFNNLAIAAGGYALAILLNIFKVRHPAWYLLVGSVVWLGMYFGGVHPTIAGVLMGLAIPVRGIYDNATWLQSVSAILKKYKEILVDRRLKPGEEIAKRQAAVHSIETITERAQSPLVRLEHGLHSWVAFGIMPIFAFANAGVTISGDAFTAALGSTVAWGIFTGLFFGKQLGVVVFSWLGVKLGIAEIPKGVTWKHIYGAAALAGIGFTMSLFITELSFPRGSENIGYSKMSILIASLTSGLVGYFWLRFTGKHVEEDEETNH